jgi:hypothetical protein
LGSALHSSSGSNFVFADRLVLMRCCIKIPNGNPG